MNLFERDYLLGLTLEEQREYQIILDKEVEGMPRLGQLQPRKNMFHEYPKAARHCLSLFPNNYLDIVDLKKEMVLKKCNESFKEIIYKSTGTERDVLNFINRNQCYHIIGAILKSGGYNFGHHGAYLFPEFQLGNSMRPDYLLIGESSSGYQFVFVELESVYGRITLKDGNLGECFNKGIRQTLDWSRWLQSNFNQLYCQYAKFKNTSEQLPQEFIQYDQSRVHYVVVAGRRQDFKEVTYRIGREYKDDKKIQLLHYDNLVDYANDIINKITY